MPLRDPRDVLEGDDLPPAEVRGDLVWVGIAAVLFLAGVALTALVSQARIVGAVLLAAAVVLVRWRLEFRLFWRNRGRIRHEPSSGRGGSPHRR